MPQLSIRISHSRRSVAIGGPANCPPAGRFTCLPTVSRSAHSRRAAHIYSETLVGCWRTGHTMTTLDSWLRVESWERTGNIARWCAPKHQELEVIEIDQDQMRAPAN